MQNPGRGRRRLVVTLVLALVGAALAPAAVSADAVSFRGGTGPEFDQFVDALPNETQTQKVPITLNWSGSDHLVPGSQVHLAPGALDPAWTAGNVTINVPSDWGFGKTARVDAEVTYTTGSTIFPSTQHNLVWNPTAFSCTLGGASCLIVDGSRRIDVRNKPNNVQNFNVDPGVVDANLTWDHSPEHLQLTHYRLIRFRVGGGEPMKFLTLSAADTTSYHDEGLTPDSVYCWRLGAEKIILHPPNGSESLPGPQPEPQICLRTGKHPAAPASGPVAADTLDADGRFRLTWDPSPDSGVTYEIEHRDDDDAGFQPLESGLTDPSYAAAEGEGTWTYRVRSRNAQGGWSDWVEGSSAVKVDMTAPSERVATTNPTAPAFGDWFKDTVDVSFGASIDPALPDKSAGSGVVSEAGDATFNTTGTHTATGTATDAAGHTSSTNTTVKVDASRPALTVTGCPTKRVLLATEVRLSYTASDEGSGLADGETGDEQLETSAVGAQSQTITVTDKVGHAASKTCEYTVYQNSAPPTPAAPSVPAGDRRDGTFDVSWGAVIDPDPEDTVEYIAQQRDADDGDAWTDVPARLGPFEFAADVGEGTWQFRVKAIDSQNAESGWSDPSNTVKVDQSGPTAPQATADRTPEFDDWFKDKVTVSFGDSTDPDLADHSKGTGVAAYTAPKELRATGAASGTATDAVGNVSGQTSLDVKVDATAPTASTESCPSNLIVGQPASMDWSARDGESGIRGASSGTLALDTSSPGTRTATGPPPVDNVGHTGDAPKCTYSVAYKFAGFLSPINGTAVNVGKTGRTYPIKWRLQRYDGSLISDSEAQALVPAMVAGDRKTDCSSFSLLPEDALEEAATGGTELRYDAAADQFIYNYKAPDTTGCYVLAIRNADGASTKQVNFTFTR